MYVDASLMIDTIAENYREYLDYSKKVSNVHRCLQDSIKKTEKGDVEAKHAQQLHAEEEAAADESIADQHVLDEEILAKSLRISSVKGVTKNLS